MMLANLGSRAPRGRFGQVHVYNNLYVVPTGKVPRKVRKKAGVGRN